jgi:hypothetical protein
MAIRVVCSNGHVLKAKDHLAGKTVLCPDCGVRVKIPVPHNGEFSEDSILDVLGPHDGVGPPHVPMGSDRSPEDSGVGTSATNAPLKKACPRCDRSIDPGTRVCPHCNTYVVAVEDL